MNKQEILDIANEAYPKIVKYFGKGKNAIPEIKVYRNVFVDLTGDEDAEGEEYIMFRFGYWNELWYKDKFYSIFEKLGYVVEECEIEDEDTGWNYWYNIKSKSYEQFS